jgi:GNAT superfamily N-acetyltransferase
MAETDRADAAVTVRAAGEADVEAITALMEQLGYPSTAEQVRARLERSAGEADYHALVAEADGAVVGFVGVIRGWSWTSDERWARVMSMVVNAGVRGRGVGAALLRAAEAWARAQGADSIHLTTATRRAGAHRFYERLGYEATGVRYVRRLE